MLNMLLSYLRFLQVLNSLCDNEMHLQSWQEAILIPLYKKRTKISQNYKAIIVLNSGYEVYASIVNYRIDKTGEEEMDSPGKMV